jgi:hypothetical protein
MGRLPEVTSIAAIAAMNSCGDSIRSPTSIATIEARKPFILCRGDLLSPKSTMLLRCVAPLEIP